MHERHTDNGGHDPLSPAVPGVDRDPTHPVWFSQQAAMALLTRYTTIQGYSSLLERVVARDPLDPAQVTRYTEALAHQVGDLGRFLEQYLQAVQLQSGLVALSRRPVGLAELFRVVQAGCANLSECSDRHILDVASANAITGQWDPHWVVAALTAIVSNAMKFTPDGGTIQMQVQRQGETAVVTVTDPGRGIQVDERERIFLPFVRGRAVDGTIPGWGLGLFIADGAVRAHGGAIDLASTPGAGTTVTIRLPLQSGVVA